MELGRSDSRRDTHGTSLSGVLSPTRSALGPKDSFLPRDREPRVRVEPSAASAARDGDAGDQGFDHVAPVEGLGLEEPTPRLGTGDSPTARTDTGCPVEGSIQGTTVELKRP